MKKVKAFLVLVCAVLTAGTFSACDFQSGFGSDSQSSASAHIHEWKDGNIKNEPTCTSVGVKVYFCECGEKKT